MAAAGVGVIPNDLARIVDAECRGALGGQGVVEGGIDAAAKEEPVGAGGVSVSADDLAHMVDAFCGGALGGHRIVESDVGDCHDSGFPVIVSCRSFEPRGG